MHPRLKRNICFSAGETIYHSPITSDKLSDISSRSNDEVQTNGVGARELTPTDFHKDASISDCWFLRHVSLKQSYFFVNGEVIVKVLTGPYLCIPLQASRFASLLTLGLFWMTRGKLTHLPSEHWKRISAPLIYKTCTKTAPVKVLNDCDKLQMAHMCSILPGERFICTS